jgi:hypothetical protein
MDMHHLDLYLLSLLVQAVAVGQVALILLRQLRHLHFLVAVVVLLE